jgi:hypothetical protein
MSQARFAAGKGPDMNDVNAISDEFHSDSRLRRLCNEMSRDGANPIARAGARRGNYGSGRVMGDMGASHGHMGARRGGPGGAAAVVRNQQVANFSTEVPHYPVDPSCQYAQDCAADLLGFNTLTLGNFPLAAPVGPPIATAEIDIGSATADKYIPRYLFWEGRDSANNFVVVPSLLTSANIGPAQQTVGAGDFNSITSAVFALTMAPLPVGWDPFRNVVGQTLRMTFGTFLPAGTIQFFGVMWGDAGLVGR